LKEARMKDPLEKALELLESSARFLLMVGNEAWAGVNLEVALVGRRRAVLGGFLYGEGQAFLAFLDPKEAE
jgi:hypothetical protein